VRQTLEHLAHHSGSLFVLLNRTSYLLLTAFDARRGVDVYQILDPETGLPVGSASEVAQSVARQCVRRAFGRNLLRTAVEVYEWDPQALVLCIRELPGLWRPRLVLIDSHGADLCYFKGRFAVIGGGFSVRNRTGRMLGRMDTEIEQSQYILRNRTGQQVGTIEELGAGNPPELARAERYLVRLGDVAGCQTGASALLLAAALALDIVYRDRVGTEPVLKATAAAVTRESVTSAAVPSFPGSRERSLGWNQRNDRPAALTGRDPLGA
jgi:hypothetical protein